MQDIFPEILRFNIPFIFLLLITFLAVYLSYYLYRHTNPESSSMLKYGLGFFRMLLFIFIIILFFNPKIFLRFVENKQRQIDLFVDKSSSMGLVNENENRPDSLSKTVKKLENLLDSKNIQVNIRSFNTVVQKANIDSFGLFQGLTDFNALLSEISKQESEQAIIVSDGIRTEGAYPSFISNSKIYTIGIGQTEKEPDLYIGSVNYKPVIYQSKEQRISVTIANTNIKNSSAQVLLFSGTNLIKSEKIEFEQEDSEQEVTFDYTLNSVGLNKLRIEIKTPSKESNLKNNTYTFTQDVVKNKLRVGLFSAYPDYEHKFLKFVLEKLPDIETHSYINIKNSITSNFAIDSLDLLIFVGFPGNSESRQLLEKVSNSLRQKRQNIIVILTQNTNLQKLALLNEFLPDFDSTNKSRTSTAVPAFKITERIHPILQIFTNEQENDLFWREIPPLTVSYALNNLGKNSEILLDINDISVSENVLVLFENSQNKYIILNGNGFWRWHFLLQNQNSIRDGYKNFVQNLVRWSADKREYKPVILEIAKNTVNPGQEIILNAVLYNAQNRLVKNGQISVTAEYNDQQFTIAMVKDTSGVFSGRYTPSEEGSYKFSATGLIENRQIGTDSKTVEVIPYNREFISTLQDTAFLQKISKNSGGIYFQQSDVSKIIDFLETSPKLNSRDQEIDLRYQSWLLFLIIGLAVSEWIIRKKNNLV